MSLPDLVVAGGIIEECQLFSKRQIVEQLLMHLAIQGAIPAANIPVLCTAVMNREVLGSTGIGRGLALPHTRHASIDRLMVGVFIFHPAVPFDCIDGELADIFAILLTPAKEPQERAERDNIEALMRFWRQDGFLESLRRCQTGEEIREQFRLGAAGHDDW